MDMHKEGRSVCHTPLRKISTDKQAIKGEVINEFKFHDLDEIEGGVAG